MKIAPAWIVNLVRDNAMSGEKPLLPDMKAFSEKTSVSEEWHATFEVLAMNIDEQRRSHGTELKSD